MKLATWNLERLTRTTSVRMSRVRAYMDAINADVWVLTETGEDVSPGPGYQGVATTEFDSASHHPGEVWTKIWSRWPVERLTPVSDPARCVAARILRPQQRPFIVYGTVLPWTKDRWRGFPSAGSVAFVAALEVQASDWAALGARFPGEDLFVMGDLNQQLGVGPPWYYGSEPGEQHLREALARIGLIAFTEGSNDPIRRESTDMACIDHICGPARLSASVRSTTRWPDAPKPMDGLSDHFGVAVELD